MPDYDRILELANQHRTLREMLGLGSFDADKRYCLQTLKDNLKLFTPHGETVLNFLTSVSQYNLPRILCHS